MNRANCPSYEVCLKWAKQHKNISILNSDLGMELNYASGTMLDENSEPLMCGLEDGVFYNGGLRMAMLQGDPLMRRVTEIIDRVVEAGIYNFWISLRINSKKILSFKTSRAHRFDGYYSFKLYHMQPAFYILFMGLCLSALCFIVEIFYNGVLSKRK
jgi:hypothetical protein